MTFVNLDSQTLTDNDLDLRPGDYFVSCRRDNGDALLVAGPWPTHSEALSQVGHIKGIASGWDSDVIWYSWGTARANVGSGLVSTFDRKKIPYRETCDA